MLRAMTIQRLLEAHHARPFRPFTIRMADGRGHLVRHPDYLAHTPAGRTAVVLRDDDSCSILDLLLVTELEFEGEPGASGEAV